MQMKMLKLFVFAYVLSCGGPDEATEPDEVVAPGDFPDDPAAFSRTVLVPDPPVVPQPYAPVAEE
jgi:hypothetical protein